MTAVRKWPKSDKRPENIPAWPPRTYEKQGWISWSDFLGVEIIASQNKKYKSYSDAKSFIQKLNLKSGSEYRKWAKLSEKPDDLPVNVEQTYKNNGWIGWGDFLGTRSIATHKIHFREYAEAKRFVRKFKFKDIREYRVWAKSNSRPKDIPYSPERNYKNKGWIDWYDYLGKPRPGEDPDSSS